MDAMERHGTRSQRCSEGSGLRDDDPHRPAIVCSLQRCEGSFRGYGYSRRSHRCLPMLGFCLHAECCLADTGSEGQRLSTS